jgi:hypothetical protein
MSDYIEQAKYMLLRKYVTGMTVDELASKLSLEADKKTPSGAMTRESVYGTENVELVQRLVNETPPVQKRLILPGERLSAAVTSPLNKDE